MDERIRHTCLHNYSKSKGGLNTDEIVAYLESEGVALPSGLGRTDLVVMLCNLVSLPPLADRRRGILFMGKYYDSESVQPVVVDHIVKLIQESKNPKKTENEVMSLIWQYHIRDNDAKIAVAAINRGSVDLVARLFLQYRDFLWLLPIYLEHFKRTDPHMFRNALNDLKHGYRGSRNSFYYAMMLTITDGNLSYLNPLSENDAKQLVSLIDDSIILERLAASAADFPKISHFADQKLTKIKMSRLLGWRSSVLRETHRTHVKGTPYDRRSVLRVPKAKAEAAATAPMGRRNILMMRKPKGKGKGKRQ